MLRRGRGRGRRGFILGAISIPNPDVTPPTFVSGTANGTSVTLLFSETVQLTNATGLTITVNGSSATINSVSGSGSSTLVLTLASAVTQGQTVTFSYALTGDLRDTTGNEMLALSNAGVANATVDPGSSIETITVDSVALTLTGQTVTTSPIFLSGTVNGATVVLNFSETVTTAAGAGIFIEVNGNSVGFSGLTGSGTTQLTLTLGTAATNADTVTFNYSPTQTGSDLADTSGGEVPLTVEQGLTNNSAAPIPVLMNFETATYDGASINDLSNSNSTGGAHDGTSGTWWDFAANTLRLTNRGLLIEPAANELQGNPSLTGGTLGNLATTGVLPSPMNFGGVDNGLMTVTLVTLSTYDDTARMNYIEIDVTATGADTAYINFVGTTTVNAVSGQTRTGSSFWQIMSGTWPGGTIRPTMQERTSAGVVIAGTNTVNAITPSTTRQRAYATRTFNQATAAKAFHWVGIDATSAITGTVRFRIYCPNITDGALTSPIKTAGTVDNATVTPLPKPSGTVLISEYVEATHKNDTQVWHGNSRWVLDAAWQPHNLTSTDNNIVRFETRSGEIYNDPGVFTDEPTSQRNQLQTVGTGSQHPIAEDEYHEFEFMYDGTVPTNGAQWYVVFSQRGVGYGQDWSAPFEIGLRGERFVVTANYETGNGTTSRTLVLRDAYLGAASSLVRDRWYKFRFYIKHGWSGGGICRVKLDEVQIVNISAGNTTPDRVGYAQQTAYTNKFGVYRQARAETTIINFKNQHWVFGANALAAYNAAPVTSGSSLRAADNISYFGGLATKVAAASQIRIDTGSGLGVVSKATLDTNFAGGGILLKKLELTA